MAHSTTALQSITFVFDDGTARAVELNQPRQPNGRPYEYSHVAANRLEAETGKTVTKYMSTEAHQAWG